MTEELKPCAHCGEIELGIFHAPLQGRLHYDVLYVYCYKCAVRTRDYIFLNGIDRCIEVRMDAIHAWNKRVDKTQ